MKQLKPVTAYFLIQAVYGALFMAMVLVSTIYRVDTVGMNAFQLLLAAAVLTNQPLSGSIMRLLFRWRISPAKG